MCGTSLWRPTACSSSAPAGHGLPTQRPRRSTLPAMHLKCERSSHPSAALHSRIRTTPPFLGIHWRCVRPPGPIGCCDVQAVATRRAFHGWLYISPLNPSTPTVRKFDADVRSLTQSEFGVKLSPREEIDATAARACMMVSSCGRRRSATCLPRMVRRCMIDVRSCLGRHTGVTESDCVVGEGADIGGIAVVGFASR